MCQTCALASHCRSRLHVVLDDRPSETFGARGQKLFLCDTAFLHPPESVGYGFLMRSTGRRIDWPVTIVERLSARIMASLYALWATHSTLQMKHVPIWTPAAPKARAATNPRPSQSPPAAMTGTRSRPRPAGSPALSRGKRGAHFGHTCGPPPPRLARSAHTPMLPARCQRQRPLALPACATATTNSQVVTQATPACTIGHSLPSRSASAVLSTCYGP